jgi:hypothetical protein
MGSSKGSPSTAAQIAKKVCGDNPDVIVAISTPSAQRDFNSCRSKLQSYFHRCTTRTHWVHKAISIATTRRENLGYKENGARERSGSTIAKHFKISSTNLTPAKHVSGVLLYKCRQIQFC